MKKIISALLLVSMLAIGLPSLASDYVEFSAEISTFDDGVIIQRADDFFNSYTIGLSKQGSGKINITFSVTAYEESSVLGVSSYDVQQKVNGTWTTVSSGITGSVGYNRPSYSFEQMYSGTAGCEYRVYARFYCMKYTGATKTNGVYSGSIVAN